MISSSRGWMKTFVFVRVVSSLNNIRTMHLHIGCGESNVELDCNAYTIFILAGGGGVSETAASNTMARARKLVWSEAEQSGADALVSFYFLDEQIFICVV